MKRTLAALAIVAAVAPAAGAAPARTSLSAVESQVMCVTCAVPLAVAESPQADRERAFIQARIDRGETLTQVKRDLVAEYGRSVLALPRAHGFDIAVYAVPVAAILLCGALLGFAARRWRRRVGPAEHVAAKQVTPAEAARLDEDLARYR